MACPVVAPLQSRKARRSRATSVLFAAGVAALLASTRTAFLSAPTGAPAPRGRTATAAARGGAAPFAVSVDVEAPRADDVAGARASIEEAFASALAPFGDLITRVDVGLRAAEGARADEEAYGLDVSVGLRNHEHPLVVSGRRRTDMGGALATGGGGLLGRVLGSVARELQVEHQHGEFQRAAGTAAVAQEMAEAVAVVGDGPATEVVAQAARASGEEAT
mmetsp:Transcript_42965/g.119504  ORF Transcript_42965/g.119504 Transcript_42965/m.119504 type:complete len:220 (-) Transcript_42965:237-896(-)